MLMDTSEIILRLCTVCIFRGQLSISQYASLDRFSTLPRRAVCEANHPSRKYSYDEYFPAKARRGIVGDDVDWLDHFSAETIAFKTQAGKIYF